MQLWPRDARICPPRKLSPTRYILCLCFSGVGLTDGTMQLFAAQPCKTRRPAYLAFTVAPMAVLSSLCTTAPATCVVWADGAPQPKAGVGRMPSPALHSFTLDSRPCARLERMRYQRFLRYPTPFAFSHRTDRHSVDGSSQPKAGATRTHRPAAALPLLRACVSGPSTCSRFDRRCAIPSGSATWCLSPFAQDWSTESRLGVRQG